MSHRRTAQPAAVDTRSTDSLIEALDRVEVEGWNGQTAGELLEVVRLQIVVPLVVASRLRGPAAKQAEASGWERAWEVLSRPSIRSAQRPWSLLWVAVRRAVRDEVAATIMQTSAREAWRYSPTNTTAGGATQPRVEGPVSLEALPFEPAVDDDEPVLGRPLRTVADAMVEAGWDDDTATGLLLSACEQLAERSTVHGPVTGWRLVADATRLPQWQVRRVMVLLVGAPGWPGLLERAARHGRRVLDDPAIQAAAASTVAYHRRPPNHAAERVTTGLRHPLISAIA